MEFKDLWVDMEGKVVSRFKRVCVFCGSSSGKRESYREAAIELAQELVRCNVVLTPNFHFFMVSFMARWIYKGLFLFVFDRWLGDWTLFMVEGVLG